MKYKLVAIDLDGTLLNEKKRIPAENKVILKELMNRGVEVIIATGRRYYSAKKLISDLELTDSTIMANNGTIVRDLRTDNIIKSRYFDHDDFYNLIREGKQRNLHAITHVDHLSEGFERWIDEACIFTSTLVDRIVTGYPSSEAEDLWKMKKMHLYKRIKL